MFLHRGYCDKTTRRHRCPATLPAPWGTGNGLQVPPHTDPPYLYPACAGRDEQGASGRRSFATEQEATLQGQRRSTLCQRHVARELVQLLVHLGNSSPVGAMPRRRPGAGKKRRAGGSPSGEPAAAHSEDPMALVQALRRQVQDSLRAAEGGGYRGGNAD